MELQVSRLKGVQALFLVLALLTTAMTIPLFGYLISITSLGIVHLVLLSFAIITFVFALRASAPRTGSILVMTACIAGLISAILMFNGIKIGSQAGHDIASPLDAYQAMYAGELTVFFVGFNIGIVSWICYGLSAVLLFLNFSSVRMRYKAMQAEHAFLVQSSKTMGGRSRSRDASIVETMDFSDNHVADKETAFLKNKRANNKTTNITKVTKTQKVVMTNKKKAEKFQNKSVAKDKDRKTSKEPTK